MFHQSVFHTPSVMETNWQREVASVCLDIGVTLIGLGLLYWGFLLVHAYHLSSLWVQAFFDQHDPLSTLGDPFMWVVWTLYWSVAIGFIWWGIREKQKKTHKTK